MKLEEIEKYEHKFNLQLPKDFRNYLLNISSETIGYYPYIISLYSPTLLFIHETENCCPDNSDIFPDKLFCEVNLDEETVKKLHDLGYYENYFIKTHSHGCTEDSYLCVKGPKYGKQGSYQGGGDYFATD